MLESLHYRGSVLKPKGRDSIPVATGPALGFQRFPSEHFTSPPPPPLGGGGPRARIVKNTFFFFSFFDPEGVGGDIVDDNRCVCVPENPIAESVFFTEFPQ